MKVENSLNKAQVMILGSYHFGKCGEDYVNTEVADVMSDKKQLEIIEVVDKLLKFKPNKIAVEAKVTSSKELNNAYLEYRSNNGEIKSSIIEHRNEIVQLGFRLANRLNHPKIYPIDIPAFLPFELLDDYAKKNLPKLHEKFYQEISKTAKEHEDLQKNNTVDEILSYLNNESRIEMEHSNLYLALNQVGAGDKYYGANYITTWYERNIKIFANLQAISEPGDRILVIYGAGHCKILRDFVSSYKEMELVDALKYL
ncbi:MAG TPA: hypothetical protein DIU45_06840 [Clostridium sp.]|nr:hypothetical protein [Clostridium sp.]